MEEYINRKLREAHFGEVGTGNQYQVYTPFHNPERMKLGSNITFGSMCYLHVDKTCLNRHTQQYNLCIEDNVRIGPNSRIEVFNLIRIRKAVLLGPNVYISDGKHNYQDADRYIMAQGLSCKGKIIIDEGSWIGANAVITGECSIGKGSVVGANTVLTDISVPAHCVVSGNPPVLVKIFDYESKVWLRVDTLSREVIDTLFSQRAQY